MSGESMAPSVIHKINNKLKFLHRNKKYLEPSLRGFLSLVLIMLVMLSIKI